MFVEIELNGEVKFGLMKEEDVRDKLVSPTTTIDCWSMCNVVVNDIRYTVLWEWSNWLTDKTNFLDSLSNLNASCSHQRAEQLHAEGVVEDVDISAEDEQVCEHELPFKVVGVTATSHRQTYLMKAHERLHTSMLEYEQIQEINMTQMLFVWKLIMVQDGNWLVFYYEI